MHDTSSRGFFHKGFLVSIRDLFTDHAHVSSISMSRLSSSFSIPDWIFLDWTNYFQTEKNSCHFKSSWTLKARAFGGRMQIVFAENKRGIELTPKNPCETNRRSRYYSGRKIHSHVRGCESHVKALKQKTDGNNVKLPPVDSIRFYPPA